MRPGRVHSGTGVLPVAAFAANSSQEYTMVAFRERSGYKPAPRLLLIIFFHNRTALRFKFVLRNLRAFSAREKNNQGRAWISLRFLHLCSASPEPNVAARKEHSRSAPPTPPLSFAGSPVTRAGSALPQLAIGRGTSRAVRLRRRARRRVPPRRGRNEGTAARGCFCPDRCLPPLPLPRGAGLGYKLSALFCMSKCSV